VPSQVSHSPLRKYFALLLGLSWVSSGAGCAAQRSHSGHATARIPKLEPSTTSKEIPEDVIGLAAPVSVSAAFCSAKAACSAKFAFPPVRDTTGSGAAIVVVSEPLTASADAPPPACTTHAAWLVRVDAEDHVTERQLIGIGCAEDTESGRACDGLGPISIEPPSKDLPTVASISWDSVGPGCGGWSQSSVRIAVSLESLALLRRDEWRSRKAEPEDTQSMYWDLTRLEFSSDWSTQQGECPDRRLDAVPGIPAIEMDEAFVADRWRHESIVDCATKVTGNRGFAPSGKKASVVLSAVISSANHLFLELVDGSQRDKGASFQVCFAESNTHFYSYCEADLTPSCARFDLDGRVLAGAVPIERALEGNRYRVELPPETGALSIVYQAADGSSLATSELRVDDVTSLGDIFPLRTEVAACKLVDGHLRFVRATPNSNRPLLSPDGFE
jgi:hypothetical protein